MDQPLAGRCILVTRAVGQGEDLVDRLKELGAAVLWLPGIEVLPPSNWQPFDDALADLGRINWLVFTSQNAVSSFFERLDEGGIAIEQLRKIRVAAVGSKTSQAVLAMGLEISVVPAVHHADALAQALAPLMPGARVLWPRAEGLPDGLADQLRQAGAAAVCAVPVYRISTPKLDGSEVGEALSSGRIDAITLGSARTLRGITEILGDEEVERLRSLQAVCIGPVVATACREAGFGRITVAEPHTVEGMMGALLGLFSGQPAR